MNYPAASGRGIRNGIDFLAASSGGFDPLVNKKYPAHDLYRVHYLNKTIYSTA
jgi:hypothetical protein